MARLLAGTALLSGLGAAEATASTPATPSPAAVTPAGNTASPAPASPDQTGKADPKATEQQQRESGIAESSDVVVTATRPNALAPVTASLEATQPQSIISRSFIEDSLPATADFNQIALISPSVSNTGAANGIGLSESKAQIRGFQDGEYNITYDGVPFGDTNDPSHHSNTFFPSNTIETEIIDRGPGNASQLGQATFGGNFNLFSRAARDTPSIEGLASYGSFNTWLVRAVAQTGRIERLGGTEAVFSAQHIGSDGARSYNAFSSNNVFGKIVVPIGWAVRLTVLGTYNENSFNQPDNDGVTLGQAARYGKYFSLTNDPNTMNYYRYNYTHKTTDFEIVKLEVQLAPGSTFENRAYTYSYDNETLSGTDPTIYGTPFPLTDAKGNFIGTASAADIAAAVTKADTVTVAPAAGKTPAVTGFGVPGYTKSNDYRVYGDIMKTRLDVGVGALTVGAWLEWSDTYRQQRDVNLVTMAPNYVEKAVTNPATGAATPQNIRFDQNSHTNHTEEFAELELRPLPSVTITPGFKHVDFNRQVDAAYNQTTRYAQRLSRTYTANLPFLTANWLVSPRLSAYFEYARGFLAPSVSVLYVANPAYSTVAAQKSTNYQAGFVYHGRSLSVDADLYKIDFDNKFASFTSPVPGVGVVYYNQGAVQYKGAEAQVTYALPLGLAVFVNGSRNYAKTDNPGQPRQQVAKAPEWTAAGGVIYRHGPVRLSLIDKWVGRQWFVAPPGVNGTIYDSPAYQSRGYNTALASVNYQLGRIRFGLEVSNLFDSQKVTSIAGGKGITDAATKATVYPYDQYLFQVGRAFTGQVRLVF